MEPAPALTAIAPIVRERMAQMVDAIVERIQASVPAYGAEDVIDTAALRRSTQENLAVLMAAALSPEQVDLGPPRRLGRHRAEVGMPLPEVLTAFRVGFAMFWEIVADIGISTGEMSDRDVASSATFVWWKFDEYSTALTEAYREATADMLLRREHERSALVEALTTGVVDRGRVWEVAAKLELPVTGMFAAVAADVTTVGEEAVPGITERLRAASVVSAWRLLPHQQVGVVSLPKDDVSEVVRFVGAVAPGRVGLSPVYSALDETPRALYLARMALGSVTGSGVRRFDDTPLASLVVAAPEAAAAVSRRVLAGVLDLPSEDQDTLLDTLEAWLQCGGSVSQAAARLFCHPNTVRQRLRRLERGTGRQLADPVAVAELSTALHALRLLPDIR